MRSVLAIVSLLASSSCASLESEHAPSPEATDEVTSSWQPVSPGVWERTLPSGRVQRQSSGIDGLRAVLARARAERAQLSASSFTAPVQLTKNQKLISELEGMLAKMEQQQEPPIATAADPDVTGGTACGGSYALGVQTTILSLVDFKVEATARWSEFGPFGPGQRILGTYTSAIGGGGIPQTDSDSLGPFVGCCASVSSSSIAGVTFTPILYGLAYVQIVNGCNFFRSYEEG